MKNEAIKTILVIDDSTTNTVLLEAVLNAKGYKIETALCVKDAHNIIAKHMPHLVLLDLLMPKINGHDFLKELKSSPKTRDIPVVVVSALTDDENIRKSLELGAIEFVKKPINIPVLIKLVDNLLKNNIL
jgi:CheY-like chemotaxis protein